MRPESSPRSSRRTKTLLALLSLAAGILVVSAIYRAGEVAPSTPVPEDPTDRSPTASVETLELDAIPERSPGGPPAPEELEDLLPASVRCIRRAERDGLAGVHIYVGVEPVGGPSDPEGLLSPPPDLNGALTLWAPGWAPVAVRAASLPSEAAFDPASASLELRLLNATADHRLLKSQLQPRTPGVPADGPWMPALEERALDLWIAERVPSGTYDLYVWVVFPDGEPRSFSHRGVEVGADEPARLSIDLAAPRDPDELESDS